MSIQLKQLFQETAGTYELKLIAGGEGLSRELTWVQFCEDIANAGFFRGNELIITTGLCARNTEWLRSFLAELIRCHACGLIVNTGKYIQAADITEDIAALCEKERFPLFTMPWKIHLADIMQDYYNRLFLAQQREVSLTELMRTAIFQPEKTDECQRDFKLRGLAGKPFYLVVFEPAGTDMFEKTEQQLLLSSKAFLNRLRLPYIIFWQQNRLILLMLTAETRILRDVLVQLLALYSRLLARACPACGSSSLQQDLRTLAVGHHEASAAAAIARLSGKEWLSFDEIGAYRLLFATNNIELLRHMHDSKLSALLAYDAQHHTQLYKTLRLYLFNNSSLQAAAKVTFTHRNTINYRITKIKELLGCNLDDSVERFEFMLAFYIADYLRIAAD